MKTRPILLVLAFLLGFTVSLHAGTEVKAFLQSTAGSDYWLKVKASIQQGQMRLDWKGPLAKGSLFYDRDSSQITLVDPLHRTLLLLPSTDQTTLRLMLALFAGPLKDKVDAAGAGAKRTYNLVAQNARAFFNGTPQLENHATSDGSYSCDQYAAYTAQGIKIREVWVTPSTSTPMGVEDYNTFRSLAHLAMDLASSLLDQLGADTAAFEQNFSGSDFPVQETLYTKGAPSMRFKVLGIQSRDWGSDTFQLPREYKMLGLLDLLKQSRDN